MRARRRIDVNVGLHGYARFPSPPFLESDTVRLSRVKPVVGSCYPARVRWVEGALGHSALRGREERLDPVSDACRCLITPHTNHDPGDQNCPYNNISVCTSAPWWWNSMRLCRVPRHGEGSILPRFKAYLSEQFRERWKYILAHRWKSYSAGKKEGSSFWCSWTIHAIFSAAMSQGHARVDNNIFKLLPANKYSSMSYYFVHVLLNLTCY